MLARAVARMPRKFNKVMVPMKIAASSGVRNKRKKTLDGHRSINAVQEWLDQVIKKHGPAREETQVGVESASDVSVSGAGRGVERRHPSIANSREHHGDHGNQNRSDEVPLGKHLCDTEHGDWRDGHDQHDTVENQIPHGQNSAQATHGPRGTELSFGRAFSHRFFPIQISRRFGSSKS